MSLDEFEAINNQLIETQKALIERERILSVMQSIDEQLAVERHKLSELMTKKQQEKQDVLELEGKTVKSVYYTLLRSHEEQLNKETSEYLEAKLAVEECQIKIGSLRDYLTDLEEQLVGLADNDELLEALQQSQQMLISKLEKPDVRRLERITKELPTCLAQHKEFLEAYQLGQEALLEITNVITILINGKNFWGHWSKTTSLSGSHDPIAEAIELSLKTQPLLDKFQQELTDISQHFWDVPGMNTPKGSNTVTFMFYRSRGFGKSSFTDLEVQSRIKKWLTHLQRLKVRLNSKVGMLETELAILERNIDSLKTEKQTIVAQLWHDASFTKP
ncbi:MAG TPA: hypothetical protein PLD25_27570 [Chloroflexota bacterium]|nr:hypothetical protein [Chloroflexota bacterium]